MDLGTAIGVVSLGIQVLQGVIDYYGAYQDYGDDIASLCNSSTALLETLRFLQVQLERKDTVSDAFRAQISASVQQCNEGLSKLGNELNKIMGQPIPTNSDLFSKVKHQAANQSRRVSYPFKCSTLAKLREVVQDLRDNLALALQALGLDAAKQHAQTLSKVDLKVDEVITKLETLNKRVVDEEMKRWLDPTSSSPYLQANLRQWSPQSGDWLLHGKPFGDWIEQPGSMWLTGMPGCGKSVFCSAAIAITEQRRTASKRTLIAYHFFTFTDARMRTVDAMMRSLVYQLARQSDTFYNATNVLFDKCHEEGQPPTIPELFDLLTEALPYDAGTYIFLDALDECDEQIDLANFIEMLRQECPDLHLFLTSRPHVVFADNIKSSKHIQIDMKSELDAINVDIERYVKQQLSSDYVLCKFTPALKAKIEAKLSDAKGMFRWASLHLQGLKNPKLTRIGNHIMERQLNNLPKTLDGTYDRILDNMDETERCEAERLLAIICFAKRPLGLPEVVDALAIDFQDPDEGPFDPSYRVKDPMAILDYCPGLITLMQPRHHRAPQWRNEPTVVLAHLSVDQYLRPKLNEWRFGQESNAQAVVACTCLRYVMQFDGTIRLDGNIKLEYHFLLYALRNFAHHLKLSDYDGGAVELAWRLFNMEHPLEVCYPGGLATFLGFYTGYATFENAAAPRTTHSAAHGLFCAVLWKVEAGINHRVPRTAIEAAAYVQDFDIFVLLHKAGAQLGDSLLFALNQDGYSQWAEPDEGDAIVSYMINDNTVNWTDPDVMYTCVSQGRIKLIRKCIDSGVLAVKHASTLSYDEDGFTNWLIIVANNRGHKDIEELLQDTCSMEFMTNLQSGLDEQKPSLFELLSEQQLGALIPPSLRYLLAVATHRYPRYLLRILNNFDELYAFLSLIVERHYLRTYGGGFTENFYGLKRERVLRVKGGEIPRAALGAPDQVRESLKLRNSDIWKNLAIMVALPYTKRKLDEHYDIHAASANILGPSFRGDALPENATYRLKLFHYYKCFLRKVYPSVNAAYYFALLAFNLTYLFDTSKYHNPFFWLIGTRIRRMNQADHKAIAAAATPAPTPSRPGAPPASQSLFSPRTLTHTVYPRLLSSLKILLPTSIFALKFLEWWHASDFARQLSRKAAEGLELPPPTITGIPRPSPASPDKSGVTFATSEKEADEEQRQKKEKRNPPISTLTNLPIYTQRRLAMYSAIPVFSAGCKVNIPVRLPLWKEQRKTKRGKKKLEVIDKGIGKMGGEGARLRDEGFWVERVG
ncbi:hypothetical protein E4T39_03871 [Aureobasidium subglaciale]|nr:hypothetical protein E4T39_03871 [Aureobasidium subglaciale]